MKIAICTCLWQRHDLTAVFWRGLQHLRAWWPHETVVVAAGSHDPAHAQMAHDAGAIYVDTPNDPLGAKWNTAVRTAKAFDPDAVFILASDDFLDRRVARTYLKTPDRFMGLKDFWFYRVRQPALGYWPGYTGRLRTGEPAGSGRWFPRRYLDALDWTLWPDASGSGLDGRTWGRIQELGLPLATLHTTRAVQGIAVAVKTDVNIWSYERINPQRRDRNFLGRLPSDVREGIESL